MRTIEFQIKEDTTEEELNHLAFFIKKNIIGAFPEIEGMCIKEYSEIQIDEEKALDTDRRNCEGVVVV